MTGSRGPVSKPDHLRQRTNTPRTALVVRAGFPVPAARAEWLESSRVAWAAYWASELALAIREAQLPMVDRLFSVRDERERSYSALLAGERLVPGSKGQPVLNPLIDYVSKCDNTIMKLEDRLGLSPRSLLALTSAFGSAQKSLDDLNRSVARVEDETDDEPDPREIRVV